jgi:hypothetical protein
LAVDEASHEDSGDAASGEESGTKQQSVVKVGIKSVTDLKFINTYLYLMAMFGLIQSRFRMVRNSTMGALKGTSK